MRSRDHTPALRRVSMIMCEYCISGAGGECHTPGCVLWLNRAPDLAISTQPSFMAADVCEVCKVCLEVEVPRCERHARTEPGDPEWEDA
jgi:hypothetical protein